MRIMQKTPTFGLIVGTRGFFNAELAVDVRARLLAILKEHGYEHVITPADATPCGAIETREHAKVCAELFRKNAERIDGVIVVLPNFGDELGIVQTLDMAGLDVPVLVQACDDEIDRLEAFSADLGVEGRAARSQAALRQNHQHALRRQVDIGWKLVGVPAKQ